MDLKEVLNMAQTRDEKGRFCKATTNNNTTLNNEKENKTMMNTKMTKREERMETLKQNGINVDNFFNLSLQIPMGATVTINVNGKEMVLGSDVTDNLAIPYSTDCVKEAMKEDLADDPIAQSIMEQGYVNNHRLFRRFVLAHTMRMLNYQAWGNTNRKGWEACMKDCFAYEYQFKMMMDEFKVLYKLQKEDIEAFKERTHFFNGDVLVATMEDYLYRLQKYIEKTRKERKRTYKGKEYVKLARYGNVLVNDLNSKIYKVITSYIDQAKIFADANDYYGMYKTLCDFMNKAYNKLPYDTTKCPVWKDAYKASGAFYSLQNMIRFHDCIIKNCDDKYDSEQHLYDLLDVFKGEEWRFHKVLVDTIERNNFNLNESIRNGNNAIGTSSYDRYNR
jgi:hypothetical protein